jgi:glycosyltransferase involved in cell wall biosynthesis
LRARGVPVSCRRAATKASPGAVLDLTRALRALGSGGVLHTHGERALLWGRAAVAAARTAHVHTHHGFVENDPGDGRRVRVARQLVRGVDARVAVHAAAAQGLRDVEVVPNCLDAGRLADELDDRDRVRRRLALKPGERCYLFCGRLSPEKGADLIGVIQSELLRRSAAAVLCVAGSGPLSPGIEAMAEVRLLGQRDDAPSLLRAADVVLMPSRSEALPMVALEAAAVGTPLVAFAVGGLVEPGLAVTVPPGDVSSLVEAALALTRDEGRRAAVLDASRRTLLEQLAPAEHARRLIEIYETVGR